MEAVKSAKNKIGQHCNDTVVLNENNLHSIHTTRLYASLDHLSDPVRVSQGLWQRQHLCHVLVGNCE